MTNCVLLAIIQPLNAQPVILAISTIYSNNTAMPALLTVSAAMIIVVVVCADRAMLYLHIIIHQTASVVRCRVLAAIH